MSWKAAARRALEPWRATWADLSCALVRALPSRSVRKWALRRMGARIGAQVAMYGSVSVRNPRGLVIEGQCSVGPGALLDARRGLRIGAGVTIASDAIIWSLHHDMDSPDFRGGGGQ